MDEAQRAEITAALLEIEAPSRRAPDTDRLVGLLYEDLRRIAGGYFRHERGDHTLQPTALVHEAYLRLVDQSRVQWRNRAHFLGVAARVMRQVLVDHARRRGAQKRGGGWERMTLDVSMLDPKASSPVEILVVDDAIDKLSGQDERAARVAELRLFGGMTSKEIGEALGVSERVIADDWVVARMWLGRALAS